MNFIKTGIYALDADAQFIEPKPVEISGERKQHLLKQYNLNERNIVILNPYANTILGEVQNTFWTRLAEKLIKEGYKVYTDCGAGDKTPIQGTEAMVASLTELAFICKYIDGYIGLRSGLLDYVLFSKCKVIAIYPGEKGVDGNDVFQAFDINGINKLLTEPINTKCWQYQIKNENAVLDGVGEWLKATV